MSAQATDARTRRATRVGMLTAALLIAQQVSARALRDTLFLSAFEPSALPPVIAAASVLSIGGALVVGRLMTRVGPERCLSGLFALNACAFVGEHLAAARAPAQVAVVLYLHIASLGAVAASAFWSALSERFDPYTAKRVIGRIGAGATFGGVVGGVLTERLGHVLPIASMLLGLALLNGALCIASLLQRERVLPAADREGAVSGVKLLRRTPYARDLALLVALLAVADIWVDYVFKAEASRTLTQGPALLSFFALFYTATALLTFVVQWLLNRAVLQHLGLGGAIALLPGTLLLTGVIAVAVPGLWSIELLRGLSTVIESSLYRSGYELLYTPLTAAAKRAIKALLDVAVGRLGAVLGSGLIAISALWLTPEHAQRVLLLGCVLLCAGGLLLALRLHAGYIEQLASSLRAGVIQLDANDIQDSTTRRTLAETASALDRAALLRSIEAAQQSMPLTAAGVSDALLERALALRSGEQARVERACREPLSDELVAFALPLLADHALAQLVSDALKPMAARCAGQLIDALLDTTRPDALRRRLPAILQGVDDERVERGLYAALQDPTFGVRERAAQALQSIRTRRGALVLSQAQIFDAVRHQLQGAPDAQPRGPRTVELVFELLGLCLERETVALSLKAVLGSDARLRGTALEYLDNVLPGDLRALLVRL